MATYTRRAVQGAGTILLMSLLASVLGYFTKVILARKLGAAEYGLFSAVFTFVIFFLFFRDLGFPQAIIRYTAQFNATKEYGKIKSVLLTAFSVQMLASVIFGIVFYTLADFLALHYFKDPAAALFLKLFIIYIFGSVFFIISKDTLLGLQKTFLFSLGELLKNGTVLLLIIFFFWKGYTAVAPVYAYALVCWLLFLFYFPFLLRSFPFYRHKTEDFSAVSKQVSWFALPVFATAVGSKIIGYIDTLMLTYFRTLEEVGIYNAVLPSALLFLYFGTAIGSVLLPLASELWAKNDRRRLHAGIQLLYKYLFAAVIPIIAVAFAFSSFFLEIFFGKEYVAGALAMQILMVGVLFFMLAGINHNIFSAAGRPGMVTKIIFLGAMVNVVLNLLLIPPFGITGAAIATAASYLLAFILSVWKMKEILPLKVPLKLWLGLFLLGTFLVFMLMQIAALLPFAIRINMAISALLGLSIYLLLLYLFKIIDLAELQRYYRLLRWKE